MIILNTCPFSDIMIEYKKIEIETERLSVVLLKLHIQFGLKIKS